MIGAKFANLQRSRFGEDRGGFGWGEVEAGLGGGKCRGELGVVFAEVVRCEEEVVEVGFGEPIAERAPNAAFCKCGYEAKFGECAWRQIVGDEFEDISYLLSRLNAKESIRVKSFVTSFNFLYSAFVIINVFT